MQNYDTALKATTASENSQGSALQENARYLESAQAKVNSLEVAWQEFALTASKSIMMDGIVFGVNALKDMTNALNALISMDPSKGNLFLGLGMLTAAMGGLATLMNPTLRGFATQGGALDFLKDKLQAVTVEYQSQQQTIRDQKQTQTALNGQTAQSLTLMERMKAGSRTAGSGMRFLGSAIAGVGKSIGMMLLTTAGVGLALAGITAAVGWVVKKFTDARNAAAEAEKKFNAQVKTYTDNKDSIDELVDRYENLKNKTNRTLKETELFYQTQKQLGNYMPELVAKVDEQGRTHLATSISIKKHVEELKKLEELKAQEKINKKKTGLDETEKEVEKLKKLEEQNKKAAKAAKELIAEQNKNGNKFGSTGEAYQNAMPKKSKDDSSADRLKADNARVQTESQLALKSAEIKKSKQEIFNLERKQEAGYYSMNKEQRAMIDLILDQVDGAELYGKKNKESLETIAGIKGLIQETADAMKNIKPFDEQMFKAGDRSTQLTMIRESATASINEIKRLMDTKERLSNQEFLSSAELTQFNTLDSRIKQLQESTNKYIPTINSMGYSLGASDMKLLQVSNSMGESQKAALNVAAAMDQAADGMDNVSDSADLATVGSATLAEQLGYSEEEFRLITDRIQGYNDILLQAANGHAITAEEMMNLVMKMPELASAFKVQNGAIKLNVDAVETLRNAQLAQFKDKVQQQKLELLNGLAESKNFAMVAGSKISSIKSVADAEMLLVEVKRQQVKALLELDKADPNSRGIMHGYDVYTRTDGGAYATYMNQINQVLGQIKALDSAASIITEGMGASIKDLDKANKAAEKQNKSTTKTEKDKQTTLNDSVYLTNKYTEAIEKATRALEKQQRRREKYAKGSRAYGEAIKKEIDLLNKQIAATKAYEKALEDANKKKKLIPTTGVSNGEVTYVVDKDGKVKEVHKPKDNTYKAPKGNKGGSSGGGSKNTKSSGKGRFVKTGSKKLAGWNGVNSAYGIKRTINGKTWTHEGIDLAGRVGDRLDSRVNGTVVHAGGANTEWGVPWQYGNCVVILSGKFLHFHAHLHKISVKTGQKVGVGQKIGEIGSTGNSTGAHLHYEIRPYKEGRKDGRKSRWGEDINPTASAASARTGKKTTYKYVPKKSGSKASSASSFSSTPSRSGGRISTGTKTSYSGSGGFTAMAASSSKKKPLSYLNRSTNKIKRGTPGGLLKGQEALYEQLGKKYGVDPVLAMAISMAETGRGTSNGIRTYKNVGGMLDPKTNWTKHIKFDNLKQGIDSHIRNLSRNYKGMTLQQIQKKYAPSGAKNDPNGLNNHWLKNVTYFYNEMFAAAGTKSKPNSNKSKNPKTEEEAKKKAKQKEKLAKEKEALANQKKAEEEMEQALAEQIDLRSQYYLELFTNRADMVRKAYDEFNKEEEDLRAKRDRMSGSTESGVKMDEKILTNAKKQRIKVEQEIAQITKDLTGKSAKYLTSARREELLQRKKDLKHTLKQEKYEELDALAELLRDKAALRARLETVQGNKYTKRNAYLDRKKSTLVGESNTDQIKEYRYTVEQEKNTRKLFAIKKRAMDYEVKKLEEVRKKYGRNSQMYKDQFELVQKYSEELMGLEQSIIDLNNAQREMLEGQADHIIDTLKEAIEQRRDAEIKAIEEVEEKRMRSYDIALNKARNAHEAKMKQMDDEQEKYNKFVDERLKAMDKEDDAHSNKKQMDEFAKSEEDIRKQLNRLSLDDSYEAKAKRKELLQQLEDLEKERTDYLYDRNRDKQREALEEERDAYNENMDDKKEKEDKAFEDYEEMLAKRREAEEQLYEDMKEQLNTAYDELLNDEKKWNAIREQVMKGHYDNAEKMAKDMLSGTSKYFKDVISNSGDTFKKIVGDMSELYDDTKLQSIDMSKHLKKALDKLAADGSTAYDLLGKSIEQNIITKLKEVLDLMKRMKDENFNVTPPKPSASDDKSNDQVEGKYKMHANQGKSGKGINVRDSINGKVIGSLMHGREYEVIRKTDTHSQIRLDNGKVGWVKNSELSTTNEKTTYGTGFDSKHQKKIKALRDVVDDFQKDYKYSSGGSKKRLSEIKKKAGVKGSGIYMKAMKDKEKMIDKMEADVVARYKKEFENAKTDDQRWKAASRFTQALQELKSLSAQSKKELDGLYNDLMNKVKDSKKGNSKTTEETHLRRDPYYTKDNSIMKIKKGTKVKVLGDKGLYYEVEAAGKKGYIYKEKIAKFKTGGMTPGNIPESGAMAILHKKELVLTEQQTANLLNTIKQTDAMMKPMKALWKMMNGVRTTPNISQRRDDSVRIENLNVDFSNNQIKDGKQGAKEFAKEFMNMQQNKFNKRF